MLTYGLKGGPDLTLEIVNGSGIGESEANPYGNFDADKYKNVLGRVTQELGDNFRLGAFGYTGKEEGPNGLVNSLWMAGVDATCPSQAGIEPAIRGAARQESLLSAGCRRDRDPGRFRRTDLPAARRRQPVVRGRHVQLGRFRPGRIGLHGGHRVRRLYCCGAISAWSARSRTLSRGWKDGTLASSIGLVTAF